ncbi:Hypothetical protein NTJ_04608 [Nesidiocoris tenuis]|uniref:Uncharacterized protein n=1 Tax=Nesidiocoris tenuis TaxID=355587 RepID=A0ABN7ALL8_9HEMI|nr:Hypothetical protein NTJ_04608 [Nesidiocoris tenuis]
MTSEYGYESDYIQESDKYIETSQTIPGEGGRRRRRRKPGQQSRKVQQQCQDNRGCLAKLLASNCWLSYLCWSLCCARPKCPAYSNCPCGPRGPCAKMKPKPCPAIQARRRNGMCKNGPPSCGSPCSTLCKKVFGKNHVHTECCCRCKDNPPLHGRRKKSSRPRASPPPPPPPPPQSADPTEYGSDAALDTPNQDVQPVLAYSKHSNFDYTRQPRIRRLGLKTKLAIPPKRRLKEVQMTKMSGNATPEGLSSRPEKIGMESPTSHKITKTFSTSQGPVRVEQKIELKGTNDSFVIVSHGKACECNLCRAVKNQKKANKQDTIGDSRESRPKSEQMNHDEDCSCRLCRVLWNEFAEQRRSQDETDVPSTLTYSSQWTSIDNYDNQGSLDSSINIVDDKALPLFRPLPAESARPKFLMNGRRKVTIRNRACYCSQCTQRRDVRKLKRKLGEDLGFAEFYKLLQNFSQQYSNGRSSSSNHWGSDRIQEPSEVLEEKIKDEEPSKQPTQKSSWRPSNWAFGTDPIFMNHVDESEDKPKIMHWLQSSPDFVKSLESKLSMFIPDPDESSKDNHIRPVDS